MDNLFSLFTKKIISFGAVSALAFTLTACGGGSDGGDPPPTTANFSNFASEAVTFDANEEESLVLGLTVSIEGVIRTLAETQDNLALNTKTSITWNPDVKNKLPNADAFSDDAEKYVELIHKGNNSFLKITRLNDFLDRNPSLTFPDLNNLFVLNVQVGDKTFTKPFTIKSSVASIELNLKTNSNGSTFNVSANNAIDVTADFKNNILFEINAISISGNKITVNAEALTITTSDDSGAFFSSSAKALLIRNVDSETTSEITVTYRGISTRFDVTVYPKGTDLSYESIRLELDDTKLGATTIPLDKAVKINVIGVKNGGNSEETLKNVNLNQIKVTAGLTNISLKIINGELYITGLKQDETSSLTVTLGNSSPSISITVGAFCPEENFTIVGIDPTNIIVPEGGSLDLTLRVVENEITKFYDSKVMWTISDNDFASIDKDGKFRGLSEGSGRVTASFCNATSVSAPFEVVSQNGDFDSVKIESDSSIINPFDKDTLLLKLYGKKGSSSTLVTSKITWTVDSSNNALKNAIDVRTSGAITFPNMTAEEAFDAFEGQTLTIKALYNGSTVNSVHTKTFTIGFDQINGFNYREADKLSASSNGEGRAFSLYSEYNKEKKSNLTHYTINGTPVFTYTPADAAFTINTDDDFLRLKGNALSVGETSSLVIDINPDVLAAAKIALGTALVSATFPMTLDVKITENDLTVHIVALEGIADNFLPHITYKDEGSSTTTLGRFTTSKWTADDFKNNGISDVDAYDFGLYGQTSSDKENFDIVSYEFDTTSIYDSNTEYDAKDHDVCFQLHTNNNSTDFNSDLDKEERGCHDLDNKGMDVWLVPNVAKVYFSEADLIDDIEAGKISSGSTFTVTYGGPLAYRPHAWIKNKGDITGDWNANDYTKGGVISRTEKDGKNVFKFELSKFSNYASGDMLCLIMHDKDVKDDVADRCFTPTKDQYWVNEKNTAVWDKDGNNVLNK